MQIWSLLASFGLNNLGSKTPGVRLEFWFSSHVYRKAHISLVNKWRPNNIFNKKWAISVFCARWEKNGHTYPDTMLFIINETGNICRKSDNSPVKTEIAPKHVYDSLHTRPCLRHRHTQGHLTDHVLPGSSSSPIFLFANWGLVNKRYTGPSDSSSHMRYNILTNTMHRMFIFTICDPN